MGESLPTAREAMTYAVQSARSGDHELAQAWVAIARELREGSTPALRTGGVVSQADWDRAVAPMPAPRPFERRADPSPLDGTAVQPLDFGQRYEDDPQLAGDPDNDADTMYGYTRGQQRPPSQTAYAAAVNTRKRLDRGEQVTEYSSERAAASSLVDEILQRAPQASPDDTVIAVDAFGPDGLQRVADVLRGDPADVPQRWATGVVETDEQRDRRFAAGAGGTRPYVRPFDAFERGRASVDKQQRELEETGILTAGDPTRCRHCDFEIYEVVPSDVGTKHRFRHTISGQAMCPTPPKHMTDAGDESYVTGPHTLAAPGGVPYRGE